MDMDSDDGLAHRRPSATHDRPARTPFGPRIRTRTKHADSTDAPSSPLSRPDSPSDHPSIDAALVATCCYAHAAVQAPASPPPATRTPHRPAPAATFVAPPPLTPPPSITFEPTPIPWKGLPLDAAQWSFSSSELQEIVSKAIRLSARESFVRLLSLQALEVDTAHEATRLASDRAAAQAKWRFEVGRRTMLMQALNSTAASNPNANANANANEPENEGENLLVAFIAQLAASLASCDTLLASVLHLSDQQSQITLIQQQHWASALAVALRKLNKAYERQGQELKRVKDRVQTLEDELEEAWREAEKMAIQFDELEHDVAEESERASEDTNEHLGQDTEEDAALHEQDTGTNLDLQPMQDTDETGTLGDITINTDIAVVVGVTATAVASKATLFNSPGTPKVFDRSDTRSIRSVKSTRSRRSTRDAPSHLSRINAARTRSRAASNASLRLPKALRSPTSAHASPIDAPPVPTFPPPSPQGQSFLDMDTLVSERALKDLLPPRYPEPSVALPTPPHSAGLPPTRVPSIWLETDGGMSTRLNGLDRTHSLQIFSSLTNRTPRRTRRSNLVMSLKGSDRGSDSATGSPSPVERVSIEGPNGSTAGPGSPMSSGSPVSLPTHALAQFRVGDSGSSQSHDAPRCKGVGSSKGAGRPGSAGARLTTEGDAARTSVPVPVATPRRSLVSRASSVILRRLSAATIGSMRSVGGDKRLSPTKSREGRPSGGSGRALVGGWQEGEEGEEQGEVMLIGSPHLESLEGPC